MTLAELSAVSAAEAIGSGEFTSEELVRACLDRFVAGFTMGAVK